MRVLHVISALAPGGAEILVRDLSGVLVQRGVDVGIAYISSAGDLGSNPLFEQASAKSLNEAGIALFEVGHAARKNALLGAMRLRKILNSYRPDVLHVHLATGLLFHAFDVLKVPAAYTHHSMVFTFPPALFRLFDLKVSEYVAICDMCKLALESRTRRPVFLIRNAVSPTRVLPKRRSPVSKRFTVLSVGGITERKDYPTLIKVAARLNTLLPPSACKVKFQVAGDGAGIDEMRRLANEAGVSDMVTFLGARRDVPELMANADLLLMTSKNEGLPMTLIEGLHASLPLVATDVGGCSEVVKEGGNGFLTKPGDVEGIAECLIRVLSDKNLASSMARESRLLSAEFGIDVCVSKHLELYQRLSRHDPRPGAGPKEK